MNRAQSSGRPSTRKSDRCFICNKRVHYAKNCPRASRRQIHLLEKQVGMTFQDHDVESLFSLENEPNAHTQFAIQVYFESSADDSDAAPEQCLPVVPVHAEPRHQACCCSAAHHCEALLGWLVRALTQIPLRGHQQGPGSV